MKKHRFLLDKLGRDKIVELFDKNGSKVKFHTLDDNAEYLDAITQKIVEELEEVFECDSKEDVIEELADLEEILGAFKDLIQVEQKDVDKARTKKREEKGGFTKRTYLEHVEVTAGSPDHEKLASDPDKYPEIIEEIKSK